MRALTAAEVLSVWERTPGRSATTSALLSLVAAQERPWDVLVDLPLSERNALLLNLRQATLGPNLDLRIDCPQCGEALELTLTTDQLMPPAVAAAAGEDGTFSMTFERHGLTVRLRPLTSADLLAVEPPQTHSGGTLGAGSADEPDELRRRLAERVVVSAHRGTTADPLTRPFDESELAWIEDCLTEVDPGAEILLQLICPACREPWAAPLDIAEFLHQELTEAAQGLLNEIHTLARAYGWRETDLLAMSAQRRRAYLERAVS